jgi:hypothetical protein
MSKAKKLGIWMDHTTAHLMEFTADPIHTTTLHSPFTHAAKELSLGKSEFGMHDKEKHQQAEHFRLLGDVIRNYEEVLLFGPTNAKVELLHVLRADHRFAKIRIETKQADKMTEPQQHALVKEYFSKENVLSSTNNP